jgi:hypothetical protein
MVHSGSEYIDKDCAKPLNRANVELNLALEH